MPYPYGLGVLRAHLELLGPFIFALYGCDHAPEFAEDLAGFHRGGNRVLLFFDDLLGNWARGEGL